MNEKVSIIVPVYNGEKCLSECIDSILSQTYTNLEIILVNDGSTDKSLDILNKYANLDKRILVLNQENKGVSAARNLGLEKASGKYVGFIDSDDFYAANAIEEFINTILKEESDIVFWSYCIKYSNSDATVSLPNELDKNVAINLLTSECMMGSVWAKLFCTSIIKENNLKFDVSIKYAEDLLYLLSYLKYSHKISTIASPLYYQHASENYLTYYSSNASKSYSILYSYEKIEALDYLSETNKLHIKTSYIIMYHKLKKYLPEHFKARKEWLKDEHNIIFNSANPFKVKLKYIISKYFNFINKYYFILRNRKKLFSKN